MKDRRFGAGGEPPTDFEERLLDQCDNLDDVWVQIGKRIGARALFALMDEASGLLLSVPTRESFVRRLYIPARDREFLAMRERGMSVAQIARECGLGPRAVSRGIDRALRTRRATRC